MRGSQDVASVLDAEYPGKIDVAYEGVGGSLRRDILRNMAGGGRMLAVGYISGYPHNEGFTEPTEEDTGEGLPPDHLLMWRNMTVTVDDYKTVFGNTWSGVSPPFVKPPFPQCCSPTSLLAWGCSFPVRVPWPLPPTSGRLVIASFVTLAPPTLPGVLGAGYCLF